MLRKIKANIPNSITCLNLLAGCVACIFSFHANDTFGSFMGYEIVYMLIGAAAVFDFCDGAAARLLHATSSIGKELDSLSDLVSFGIAPGLLMYNTMSHFNGELWTAYAALIIIVLGAVRLARFNVDDSQSVTFSGLPIPANAIFWIGACSWINANGYPGDAVIVAAILIISGLMVAPIKMFSLKFHNFAWRENLKRYVIILAAISFVISCGIDGLAWTIILYILLSVCSRKSAE